MNKNDSVVAYVAVGDTSALPTVSDSCEASVGKVRQGKCVREAPTVRVGVLLNKKGMNHCPSLSVILFANDYSFDHVTDLQSLMAFFPTLTSASEALIMRSSFLQYIKAP